MKETMRGSPVLIRAVFMAFLILLMPFCKKEEFFDTAALNDFLKSMQPISVAMPAEKNPTAINTVADTASEYIYLQLTTKRQQATMTRLF